MSKEDLFLMRRKKKIKLSQIAESLNCSIALLSKYENSLIAIDKTKEAKYKQFILNY